VLTTKEGGKMSVQRKTAGGIQNAKKKNSKRGGKSGNKGKQGSALPIKGTGKKSPRQVDKGKTSTVGVRGGEQKK